MAAGEDFWTEVARVTGYDLIPTEMPPGASEVWTTGLSPDVELDQEYTRSAIQHCESLVAYYPQSEHAERARAIIADMQAKLAMKLFYVGQYYFKRGAFDSAILSFNELLEQLKGFLAGLENLKAIIAPTSVGIVAAAQVQNDQVAPPLPLRLGEIRQEGGRREADGESGHAVAYEVASADRHGLGLHDLIFAGAHDQVHEAGAAADPTARAVARGGGVPDAEPGVPGAGELWRVPDGEGVLT